MVVPKVCSLRIVPERRETQFCRHLGVAPRERARRRQSTHGVRFLGTAGFVKFIFQIVHLHYFLDAVK